MFLAKPKILHWTFHARDKMRFYKLSEARVKRIIHSPKRIEEGIAPKTIAMMQPASGGATWKQEIWVMVQEAPTPRRGRGSRSVGKITKIISAWRYPGKTKPGQALPREIMEELKSFL